MPLKRIVLESSESSSIRLNYFTSFICKALIIKNNQNELLERYIDNVYYSEEKLFEFLKKYGDEFSTNPNVDFIDNDENTKAVDEFTFLHNETKKDNVLYRKKLSHDQFIDIFKKASRVSALTQLCKKLTGDELNFSFLVLQLGYAKKEFDNWIIKNMQQELSIDLEDKDFFIDLSLQELQIINNKNINKNKFIFKSI